MKHLAIDYFFVRQQVNAKAFKVRYVPTTDQLADGMTKPLARQRFDYLLSKTSVVDGTNVLRGNLKTTHSAELCRTHARSSCVLSKGRELDNDATSYLQPSDLALINYNSSSAIS